MGTVAGHHGIGGEQGFTIVEVIVAMVVMLVGVLGTLVLIEGSLASTSSTTAREQGTNLARDLVERSRQAEYANVTMQAAPASLRATLPATDGATALAGSTFMVTRRNVRYTVNIFACSIDDPTDGAGQGDATFCDAPTTTHVPGDPPPGPAAAVNVFGIAVAVGGTLLQTVCQALGNPAILGQLTAAVSVLAPISICPDSTGGGTVQYDSQPDDLRRVRFDVTWSVGGQARSVSQTTLLTNPLQS